MALSRTKPITASALLTTAFSSHAALPTITTEDAFGGKDRTQPREFVFRNNFVPGLPTQLAIRGNEKDIMPLAARTIAENIAPDSNVLRRTGNIMMYGAIDIVDKNTGDIHGQCNIYTRGSLHSALKSFTLGRFGQYAPAHVGCVVYSTNIPSTHPSYNSPLPAIKHNR